MTDKIISALEKKIAADQAELERLKGITGARDKVEALASDLGYTMQELYPDAPTTRAKSTKPRKPRTPPMYRNIHDGRKTWSGKGDKPQWVIDVGADLELHRVK
ncbi:H-NS histone family protein [Pseudorhodobacter turbinis]|nr:H-NS histone family protein [Pseudorhodobacter turbinis]